MTFATDAPVTIEVMITEPDAARPEPDVEQRRTVPGLNFTVAMCLTAAVALLIAMGEMNRLSADVLDDQGRSWSFTALMGPARLFDFSAAGWTAGTGSFDGSLTTWLRWYLVLDAAFVVLYARGLFCWFRERCPAAAKLAILAGFADGLEDLLAFIVGRPPEPQAQPNLLQTLLPWVSGAKWALVLLVLFMLVRRFLLQPAPGRVAKGPGETHWPTGIRVLVRALYTQRFSLLPLLPLLFLSVMPGPDMADQLPDVQRRWADGGLGPIHGLAAAFGLLVLAVVVFVLGRLRSDFVVRLVDATWTDAAERPDPVTWIWLAGPAAITVVGFVVPTVTHTQGMSPTRLCIFGGVPFAIGIASLVLGSVKKKPDKYPGRFFSNVRGLLHRPDRALQESHLGATILVGDALAVLALSVGGVGLVRSFTAVVVLNPDDATAWALVIIGATVAVGVWPAAVYVMGHLPGGQPQDPDGASDRILGAVKGHLPGGQPQDPPGTGRIADLLNPFEAKPDVRRAQRGGAGIMAACAAGYLILGAFPLWMAHNAGVIASVILAMTLLTGIVGGLVVALQYGGAPYLFWFPWTRLRAAPVVSLLVITVLMASWAGGDTEVHGVRGLAAGTEPTPTQVANPSSTPRRASMESAFDAWLMAPNACSSTITTTAGTSYTVRPLVMVAAEGGGIRAAYWSAAALQLMSGYTLSSGGQWAAPKNGAGTACGASSVLFSSGASGGAVGLTVTRFAAQPTAGGKTVAARDQVLAMAAPDALGAGVIGLLVRDLVYAASGIPMPVAGSSDITKIHRAEDGTQPWVDRAGLMEYVWENATTGLGMPFLPAGSPTTTGAPSGHLVFGSTSMTTGCRMLVSQLALTPPGQPSAAVQQTRAGAAPSLGDAPANGTCNALTRPAPGTVDLFADYDTTTGRGSGCLRGLTAATGAMLAARFPYVTPSGVIGPCGPWPTQQLVDGGYAENTGIGTVVDLAAQWLPLVEKHNTNQLFLAAVPPERGAKQYRAQLVVPLIVYLDNGTGSDQSAPNRNVTTEILVPLVGQSRAKFAQADTPALLQRAAALGATGRLWDPNLNGTTALAAAITNWRPQPVVVVKQSTFPAVTAPLGWVLSGESVATMDKALWKELQTGCSVDTAKTSALCADGIGTLADGIAVLTTR